MTVSDSLHYLIIGNPVSKAVAGATSSMLGITFRKMRGNGQGSSSAAMMDSPASIYKNLSFWKMAGNNHNFVRLAGFSGAVAIILGAIGGHRLQPPEKSELKNTFEIANRFHFYSSLALLGIPMARNPKLSGALMILGTIMFCGPIYYRAFTGEKFSYAFITPFGGFTMIAAWLSMML